MEDMYIEVGKDGQLFRWTFLQQKSPLILTDLAISILYSSQNKLDVKTENG